jgi:hypothetical protein
MTTDEIGHAERITLHQGFTAELGSATCAPSRAARPHLAQQVVGVPLRIVEHAPAHHFEVRNARRQQGFGPGDATRLLEVAPAVMPRNT